jgi:hypothetical protein
MKPSKLLALTVTAGIVGGILGGIAGVYAVGPMPLDSASDRLLGGSFGAIPGLLISIIPAAIAYHRVKTASGTVRWKVWLLGTGLASAFGAGIVMHGIVAPGFGA